ncbi:squamous cell carcinoma antigen recognized by T-cells 3 isoform X6 [Durio zibethinus]|uniref:Squamous cell carcinoma antigen recognized by T-cells 3 isoform X6 n=1 Tax=Durio zibethinus TaxID=66656 RepID=A0A6P5X4W4_DURZI|nr:squamous cell carcinoma antigen recognized by T-cells 3 isoform X6 [Durio zibethinus]
MEQVEKSPISKREDTEMGESDVDENPKSIGKSSSDSESSDSEDEAEQNGQLLTLESELSTNPSNYDAHVQYIKLLRRRGEIEKLREARENMNALFPLSPSMWVEWAKDEASLSNDSDSEAVEKLYERGISEYLSIPLWSEYLNYVQEHDPQVRECSADGISKARNLFERAVTAAALHIAQGSQIWDAYTQFEQAILLTIDQSDIQVKEKQVQRIRSIFHRCLSIPFANLKSTLLAYKAWEVEQGNALCAESDDVDGIEPHVASAYQKAEKMYNARAHLEEQITREDISESERFQNYMVFEKSLQCTFSTLEEYHDLFLTRVDGLRRRMSLAKGDDVLNYSLIRECFQQAADYLSPHMKNNDGLLRLYAYWARLELKLGNDLIAARGVWESLLKTCGSMLEAWKGYIAMEIELGHINEVRAIYKRCYSKRFSGTGSEDICQAWLRFEREFGTLEDLNYAVEKVTPRLEELQLFRLQQESKSFSEATYQREQNLKKTVREKRKSGLSTIDEQSPAKRQKNTSQSPKNLHEEKDTQRQNLAEANVRKEQKGKVEKQVNELLMKDTNPSKTRLYTDQCTAFLSNLSFKAKDEDLHRFFSDVGGVTSIRILYNKFTGQSRGLAYVDFEDDEHLAAAVAKNKQMLLGKSLSIARSNPKQGRKGSIALTAPDGHDFNDLECTNRLSIMLSKLVEEDASNRSGIDESSESKESVEISKGSAHKRVENIQLKGKNTFAVPRNVRPLGWTTNKPRTTEEGDDKPKSNDEFRKMFMKT